MFLYAETRPRVIDLIVWTTRCVGFIIKYIYKWDWMDIYAREREIEKWKKGEQNSERQIQNSIF